MKPNRLYALVAAALLSSSAFDTTALAQQTQTTAFTYQGQLNASGAFPTGNYLFTFTLFDAASNGNMVGMPVSENVLVLNGLFTVDLDFGPVFNTTQYWLEISVNGQTLQNRQRVNSVPVADYALSGNPGPTGAAGATGATGPTGADSTVAGPTGATGPLGPTGATGPTGTPGPTGLNGATGVAGPVGPTGPTGPIGATGPTGAASTVPGPPGSMGPAGATGPTGPAGTITLTTYSNTATSDGGPNTIVATCASGTVISGGCESDPTMDDIAASFMSSNTTWTCKIGSAGGTTIVAHVYCN